jgi:hypothetical protein
VQRESSWNTKRMTAGVLVDRQIRDWCSLLPVNL